MKIFKIIYFKRALLTLFCGYSLAAHAQSPTGIQSTRFTPPNIMIPDDAKKLPNIQPAELRAPDNIKIDGDAAEWNDTFGAYNRATDVFYTIANDGDNLYFIIRAVDPGIIKRITTLGITLMVNTSGKKNNKDAIAITYPVYNKNERPVINMPGSATSQVRVDSLMNINNKRLADKAKYIKVTGIPGLDTVSIYNEAGIKTAGLFNNKMQYTSEFAVPLKHLGLLVTQPIKFAYNLVIPGMKLEDVPGVVVSTGSNGLKRYTVPPGLATEKERLTSSTTDFWGEYTLAKK